MGAFCGALLALIKHSAWGCLRPSRQPAPSTNARKHRGMRDYPLSDHPFSLRPSPTATVVPAEPPERLDDPCWLHTQYVEQRYGVHLLARMTGSAPSTVHRRLQQHGIAPRPRRISSHPCCSYTWLDENYVEQRLSLAACAKRAGVCRQTVKNWLNRHGIDVRDRREAARAVPSKVRYP